MKKFFCSILRFLNLVDRSCNLSITNIALIVLLVKLAIAPTFTLPEVAAFFLALLNYGHKRHETNKAIAQEVPLVETVPQAVDLAPIQAEIDSLKANQEAVAKLADDTKKLLSQSNLAHAFTPRSKRND